MESVLNLENFPYLWFCMKHESFEEFSICDFDRNMKIWRICLLVHFFCTTFCSLKRSE